MNETSRPSKQFIIIAIAACAIIGAIFISQANWFHNLFHIKKRQVITENTTLGSLLTKDSNGNGIPDWEEELWGLDPTVLYTNGKPNAEIINEKKKALGVTDPNQGAPQNETDAIAQQLFSITTALSQNQNIDSATLQNIANKLGSSVNIKTAGNKYSLEDLHTVTTSPTSLRIYDQALQKILGAYNLNNQDIAIIINAAQTGDYSKFPDLAKNGDTYNTLAKALSTMSVPVAVESYHLDIVNSYAGMAESFNYLVQVQDNSTQALVGIALYKIYLSRGETAFYDLNNYLTKYGILSQ
jgi:hypothetical protein